VIRLDRALLLGALAALGCARTPPPLHPAAAIVAPATIAQAPREPAPAPLERVAFPVGWVRGALAPEERPSFASKRRAVTPEVLRVADLPVVEVTPRPVDSKRPSNQTVTPGELSQSIFITSGCGRASVRDHAFGFIQVGWFAQPIAPQSGGGVSLWHVNGGDGHYRYPLASWQTLDRGPGGALRFQETNAWFDMTTCKAYEVRRMEAAPQPLAGGLAYVFRTRCPSCNASKMDVLHVLTPDNGWDSGPFDHREITLGAGTSSTTVFHLGTSAIHRFHEIGAAAERAVDVVLGLDVVQGTGEAEPTAVVYVSE
jgi:hypothetical protein